MKQTLLLFCALFFSYSNAQNHLISKGNIIKKGAFDKALRISGSTVLVIDSSFEKSDNEILRLKAPEYTEFGFIGITERKRKGTEYWVNYEKFYYYLNSAGKVDSFYAYDVNRETGDWKDIIDYKILYEYDDLGNELSYTFFDSNNNEIIPGYKIESFYENVQLDSTITYDWDNSKWNKSEKTVFLYNDNKLLKTKMEFDYTNGFWLDTDSTEFYYNDHIFADSSIKWIEGNLYSKKTSFFDSNGNDTLSSSYDWSESSKSWEIYGRNHFSFNTQNNLSQLELRDILIYEGDYMINTPIEHSYFRTNQNDELEKQYTITYYYSEKVVSSLFNEVNQSLAFYYPNPASSTIEVSEEVSKTTILDVYGKSLLISKAEIIDVSNLSNGSYILLLETDKGSVSEKLIIQR